MPIHLRNELTERLARELAAATGQTITEAITEALRERLARVRRSSGDPDVFREIAAIQRFVREQPVRDARRAEEILGYDEYGLPR